MTRPLCAVRFPILTLLTLLLVGFAPVQAQLLDEDTFFFSGMEGEAITPLFPIVDGDIVLPDSATSTRLRWVLDELAAGETTTLAEVSEHFTSAFDPASIQSFFNDTLRPMFADARITDLIGLTDLEATLIWTGTPAQEAFVVLRADLIGEQKINFFLVNNFSGTVQYPADQNLTLEQAADAFLSLGSDYSLLVAYLDSNHQCVPITQRESQVSRATASMFKTWILGAVAESIADGSQSILDIIPLVAGELAQGSALNSLPMGTPFTVEQLAVLMMANSDNTATDLLHEQVGRDAVADYILDVAVADPDVLLPLLGISEQFHLFYSFPLNTSLSYVNGSEPFQQQFLTDQIIPLGPTFPLSAPFFHPSLLTAGSWKGSPMDLCRTLARLHQTAGDNGAFDLVDLAMGSQAAQPDVRTPWDRVWYKGGSLSSGANGLHVLTHGWLLENEGDSPPIVVIAMANEDDGGIDQFAIQSLSNRMIELVRTLVP